MLLLPGLPGVEALVSATLIVEALVLLARWPVGLLLPAFGLHGYALSSSVLGWTQGEALSGFSLTLDHFAFAPLDSEIRKESDHDHGRLYPHHRQNYCRA